MITFKSLGLQGETLKGVLAAGYESPTPIQEAAIPIAIKGRDMIGCAQTGTGKTAAFVLPLIQQLSASQPNGRRRPIRALVVTPTRELALQVEEAVRTYGKFCKLYSIAIFGGVGINPQIKHLRRGVDIVVATPGRLLDHIDRGNIDLSEVEVLVLDEADRMFDMGFIRDIRKIVKLTPNNRQTLLFSATMPPAIQELTRSIQYEPEFIEIGHRRNPAQSVTQRVCMISSDSKMDLLTHVLKTEQADNVIIFSRTKHRADRIAKNLGKRGFSTTVMHSNRSQSQRQKALAGFRSGQYQILVATDIAARGIDVDGISHVINFDTPSQAEDYIHRIGRTGRADANGDAITFVTRDEQKYLRDIERHTGKKLERMVVDGFVPDEEVSNFAPRKKSSGRSSGRSSGYGRSNAKRGSSSGSGSGQTSRYKGRSGPKKKR